MGFDKQNSVDKQAPYIDPGLVIDTKQEAEKRYQRSYNARQLFFNGVLSLFTVCLFFANLGALFLTRTSINMTRTYINITKESADAAHSAALTAQGALDELRGQRKTAEATLLELHAQTETTRQQLRGTQAAFVTFQYYLERGDDGRGYFSLRISNEGNVIARNVSAKLTLSRKSLPEGQQIGETFTIDRPAFQVPPGSFTTSQKEPFRMRFLIPGVTPDIFTALLLDEQTLTVNSRFSYDDGFGDIYRLEPKCESSLVTDYDQSYNLYQALGEKRRAVLVPHSWASEDNSKTVHSRPN
jgi:hypothetical protein